MNRETLPRAEATPKRLFEPVRIGPLTLKNRTIRAAAFEGMCPGQRPSAELLAYHASVAAGGVGMTTLAYAAVARGGLTFLHQLWLRPEITAELRQVTDAVHAAGARVSVQLGHGGNMSRQAITGERGLSPSGKFNLYGPTWPRAMDKDDVRRVVAAFGEAVRVAAAAGFDAVELHAGHGYLLSQFLSPYTNHRRDEYGGSLGNRQRLLREVLEEVLRAAAGRLAVLVKMNLSDGFKGGQTLEEAVAIGRTLEQDGAHALVLSGGFVSRTPMYIMRGAMPTGVMGALMPGLLGALVQRFGRALIRSEPYTDTYFLEDAKVLRRELSLPLVYVGGAASRAAIDRVLGEGFDAVAMARALIREPAFVHRMQREEHADAGCDHCNYCAARIYTSPMACWQREPPPQPLLQLLDTRSRR